MVASLFIILFMDSCIEQERPPDDHVVFAETGQVIIVPLFLTNYFFMGRVSANGRPTALASRWVERRSSFRSDGDGEG